MHHPRTIEKTHHPRTIERMYHPRAIEYFLDDGEGNLHSFLRC